MSTDRAPAKTGKTPPDPRAERLKAALKANIAKRKQQARARDSADTNTPDTRPEQD
jgi:hypothetical protein